MCLYTCLGTLQCNLVAQFIDFNVLPVYMLVHFQDPDLIKILLMEYTRNMLAIAIYEA